MSGISLAKRTEKVGIILAKRGITKVPPTRVALALDVSGSAQSFYTSGVMQETIDRLLAVAVKFDDNGELDTWLFHNDSFEMPTITEADQGTYVRDKILRHKNLWCGTEYAPVLQDVMEKFYPKQPAKTGFLGGLFGGKKAASVTTSGPSMVLFITDGANSDESQTARVLREAAANSPVYFNMIGIGSPSSFNFIQRMADELPNVGFVSMSTLTMTDDELYEQIVNPEFCEWIKKITPQT